MNLYSSAYVTCLYILKYQLNYQQRESSTIPSSVWLIQSNRSDELSEKGLGIESPIAKIIDRSVYVLVKWGCLCYDD